MYYIYILHIITYNILMRKAYDPDKNRDHDGSCRLVGGISAALLPILEGQGTKHH